LLCIFPIYEVRNRRKHLKHQIQSIAVTDNNAMKLLKKCPQIIRSAQLVHISLPATRNIGPNEGQKSYCAMERMQM